MDGIIQKIIEILSDDIGGEWVAFIISLLPILELRGGTLAAFALGVPLWKAFVLCGIGTLLPVPFVLLFFRQIIQLRLRRHGPLDDLHQFLVDFFILAAIYFYLFLGPLCIQCFF